MAVHFGFDQCKQKGFAHALLLIVLLAGLAFGVYLVQQKTNLFSRAASGPLGGSYATPGYLTPSTSSPLYSSPSYPAPSYNSPSTSTSSRRVFVTSATYNGNLGGLTGADAKCQTRATAASLGGSWKAWLSDGGTSAASRLEHETMPYKLLNGNTIASNWADLVDGLLLNPLSITELGTARANPSGSLESSGVWTNTNNLGGLTATNSNCQNWSSGQGLQGGYGTWSSLNYWTNSGFAYACNVQFPIYCFEQASTPSYNYPTPSTLSPTPTRTPTPTPAPVELLKNGGFEDSSTLLGWGCQPGGTSGTCTLDTTQKHGGTKSVKVVNSGKNWWGNQVNQGTISTIANEKLCLSAWVKKETASIRVAAAIQQVAPPWNRAWEINQTSSNTDWQLLKTTLWPQSNWGDKGTKIQVYLRAYTKGTVWFDDISLTKGTCK